MSVTFLTGFEGQDNSTSGIDSNGSATFGFTGTASNSTTQARTGTRSIRCNPISGASGYVGFSNSAGWKHFGLYIATLPSLPRSIIGQVSGNNVTLNSDGTLSVRDTTTVIGTTATALATGRWYWIGYRDATVTGVLLQVDGVDAVSGTNGAGSVTSFGLRGTEASAVDIYLDDFIFDDSGFLAPSKVGLLLPAADSAVGTGWTLGTGTAISANSGSTAVKNTPPVGVADLAVGSDPKQIRNASNNANVNYDATMTTYSAVGIAAVDTILAVLPIIATAAPVTTSAKAGTVGVVSNPTIANVALGAGGTAGAFWSGVTAGTYPTGWKVSLGTLTVSPSVVVGTAPVMRITQVTSSTRIAMVSFMGIYVAWTPGKQPYRSPYPVFLAQ